jgi:hypothetical protein
MDMRDYTDDLPPITSKEYWVHWDEFQRRVAAIKLVGGISDFEVEQGAVVPKGWKHDAMTYYYVPPDFITSTTIQ